MCVWHIGSASVRVGRSSRWYSACELPLWKSCKTAWLIQLLGNTLQLSSVTACKSPPRNGLQHGNDQGLLSWLLFRVLPKRVQCNRWGTKASWRQSWLLNWKCCTRRTHLSIKIITHGPIAFWRNVYKDLCKKKRTKQKSYFQTWLQLSSWCHKYRR